MNRFRICIAIILVLSAALYWVADSLISEKKEMALVAYTLGEARKCGNDYRRMSHGEPEPSGDRLAYCLHLVTGPNDFDTVGKLE